MSRVARDHRDDGCAQPAGMLLATIGLLAGLLVALIRRSR